MEVIDLIRSFYKCYIQLKSLTNKINKRAFYHIPHGVSLEKTRTGKIVNGEAKIIEYYMNQSKIIFLKKAILTQSNNVVKSNKIIYKTDSENIIAGDNKGDSRVKMTLEPKKNE